MTQAASPIVPHYAAPPVPLPEGHIGPVVLPGSERQIWWTGRVAIGLRYERRQQPQPVGQSALWLQDLMLAGRGRGHASRKLSSS